MAQRLRSAVPEDTVSLAEAAALMGRCVETIYRLVRSRRIQAVKDTNGHWRIPRKALAVRYGNEATEQEHRTAAVTA